MGVEINLQAEKEFILKAIEEYRIWFTPNNNVDSRFGDNWYELVEHLNSNKKKDGYLIKGNFLFEKQLSLPIFAVVGNCKVSKSVETLIGSPYYVTGNFDCSECSKLITLIGSPEYVGGDFICSNCNKLESTVGSSKIICGNFIR